MEKYTINLDWFEITVLGSVLDIDYDIANKPIKEHYHFENLRLFRKHEKLQGYRCKFEMQLGGERIGYLLYKKMGYSSVPNEILSRIHLYNNILYQENWYESLVKSMNLLGLTFNNYFRLDIAIDSYNLIQKFNHLYRSTKYQLVRGNVPRGKINPKGLLVNSIKIGSEQSGKLISIYAKEELLKKHYKSHIVEAWNKNGLGPIEGNQIDRVELKLMNSASKNIELGLLTEPSYLSGIAKQHFRNLLRFLKVNPNQQNKSRWESIEFINWRNLENVDVKPLVKAVPVKTIAPKKTTIQQLYRENKSSHNPCYTQVIDVLVKKYQLEDWYHKNCKKWD